MNTQKIFCLLISALMATLIAGTAATAQDNHDYLKEKYANMHHSPVQEKFEKIAPMPIGAVYVMRPGDTEEDIRWHFRTMKKLGYTNLKQLMTTPEWSEEEVKMIALEEGIIPWWYSQGGWEAISDELLNELGIPEDTPVEDIRNHPKMQEYQLEVMKDRVRKTAEFKEQNPNQEAPDGSSTAFDPQVGGTEMDLTEEGEELFVEWAKEQYGTIEKLNEAYNQDHAGLNIGDYGQIGFSSWEDFEKNWKNLSTKEYRHIRDVFRFKADHNLDNIRNDAQRFTDFYPHAPYRGGGELGLFYPQTWYNVDLEGIAEVMTDFGTFYPSMHFSWHFERVDNEVLRPTFMQASYATDIFKGGWAAAWESTGGPQYFSGSGHGFKVDDHTMTQFIYNHIAAGFKGFGLWAWSARTAGWEAGEYSLLGKNNEITPRARKVGKIGQALQEYRDELWDAQKEPYVGVFADWNNEAVWTTIAVHGEDDFRMFPIEARVGASRALINGDVPFEYVTESDLRKGLAQRYRVIYMSATLAIEKDMFGILTEYVENGGRLVMDMPGAWYDSYTQLLDTGKGSKFEQLFGAAIHDYQKADKNRPNSIGDFEVHGVTAGITPYTADVVASFSDRGEPAITEHHLGEGTAVLLGYEASHMTFKPGNKEAEQMLRDYALGPYDVPFHSEEAIAYRIAAPEADHYFLLNDSNQDKMVNLDIRDYEYSRVTSPVTGETHELGKSVMVESHSGRWLRFEK
ncbi:beta-galactosidase trimerization domain-containing protein [Halalkalibaculum sp. DA3122]|uniref:beta-galactosidase trimerization domain-containing protein n=1 Tax=Halalkalibaculum sp. DA3122 TaxID=3373607 RepID=UPI003753F819